MNRSAVVILCFLWTSTAFAQEFVGSRSMAMGEAMRGSLMLNDAIYINPAAMAPTKKYAVDAQTVFNPIKNQDLGYSISLIDTRGTTVGAGFGYTGGEVRVDEKSKWRHFFHLAVAEPISPVVSVGAALKYGLFENDKNYKSHVNGDLGLLVIPGKLKQYFQIGAVLHNFVKDEEDFPRELGLGTRLMITKGLSLSADMVRPISRDFWVFGFGGEYIDSSGISLRSGFHYDDKPGEGNAYSAGVGYFAKKAGINYAFKNRIDNSVQTHALSLALFF